jgi:hypothetical protein
MTVAIAALACLAGIGFFCLTATGRLWAVLPFVVCLIVAGALSRETAEDLQ